MGNRQTKNKEIISNQSTIIPLHGVSLSYLLETFNLTEEQDFNVACEQVKKMTKGFKGIDRSLASYLKSNPKTSQYVKEKADVFISYAWKGSWAETMAALKHQLEYEKHDTFIWMDVVCVDQHKTNDLNFKDWSRVFQTSLEQIGKAVIVVVPAENPIVPKRSWCCFEMTQMVRAKINNDICISPNDTQKLIDDMKSGQINLAKWNSLFSIVNVEKSVATKYSDQIAILELMKEIGVVQVNNVVQNALKKLYVTLATSAENDSGEKQLVYALDAHATLHQALGEFDNAKPFFEKSLEMAQSFGNENDLAYQLNNFASLLYSQGKIEEAIPLFQQAMAIDKKVYGEDHPDVATDLNNLAQLLSDQGKYDEAIPFFEQSIAIFKKALGEDHPNVATLLNNLAELLRNQGKFEEAKSYYEEANAIWKKALGEDHPRYATGLNNLAVLLRDQGKKTEARQLGKQAYQIVQKSLGEEHPDTVSYKYWETF